MIIVGYTTDRAKQVIIAFSSVANFDVRLPCGDDNTSVLHLFIVIRDTLDCITEFNITSVTVLPDTISIANLMSTFQNSSTTNPIIRLLFGANQNTAAQILTSLSQQLNKINNDSLNTAIYSN